MASLKCSHCGFRIHYHDEPNGIEYTALSQKLWDLFSDTDKPIARYVLLMEMMISYVYGDALNVDVFTALKHIDHYLNRHMYLVRTLLFLLRQENILFLLIFSLKIFLKKD